MTKTRQHVPRSDRIPFQILVVYKQGEAKVTRFCSNLSEGGIFIESLDSFPMGTMVDLKFTFPMSKSEVAVSARVAWIREASATESAGMGLEFVALDDSNRAQIIRAIDFLKTLEEN